jgi:pimeloyl-ACP methyl ester carboxylesterase
MLWKWCKRIALGFICFIVALLLIGAIFQAISLKMDEKRYPPPGKLVDIGGYKLHINKSGTNTPTVILDAGLGCNSLDWTLVQPKIAQFTTVCSYDRAGYGWSDASKEPRTLQNIVHELHTLLQNANIQPPYIFVGHSFGGLTARLYADDYPDEVFGAVLVDAAHENHFEAYPEPEKNASVSFFNNPKVVSLMANTGILRLLFHSEKIKNQLKAFPSDIREMYINKLATAKSIATVMEENECLKESVMQLKNSGGNLGDKPLTVITANIGLNPEELGVSEEYRAGFIQAHDALQKDLVTKSSRGKQIFTKQSGHMITHDEPDIIVEAVREMVNEYRLKNQQNK